MTYVAEFTEFYANGERNKSHTHS